MSSESTSINFTSVNRPIESAIGLPKTCYTDPAHFQLEQKRVLGSNWIGIALDSDAAQAGDVYPITAAGQALIVVRDRDQQIRVFHNVCRHRGAQLVDSPCNNRRNLVCPYHAWSYGLDGKLVNTPHFSGVNQHSHTDFEEGSQDLAEVRSGVWHHIVFVNLSGDAQSLQEYTRILDERWAAFDLDDVYHGGSDVFEIRANWKLVLENFVESYHLPMVHPELARYSPLQDHELVVQDNVLGQLSLNYQPSDEGKGLPHFADLPEDKATTGEYLLLFPTLMLSVTPDHFRITFINPISPQLTHQRWEFFFVGKQSQEQRHAAARAAVVQRVHSVTSEDLDILQKMQAGRNSEGFDGGRFSPYHETTTHHFQKLVAACINVA
jgi:choline monooxygenase